MQNSWSHRVSWFIIQL